MQSFLFLVITGCGPGYAVEGYRLRSSNKVGHPMVRLCATFLICLLSSLNSVHAAPAPHPHWSVGFHEMSFLDPLDLQPMRAIAFYPSTDVEHTTRVGWY